ncbi:hypothetical protein CsatA_027615 [Cannabis sativa]
MVPNPNHMTCCCILLSLTLLSIMMHTVSNLLPLLHQQQNKTQPCQGRLIG